MNAVGGKNRRISKSRDKQPHSNHPSVKITKPVDVIDGIPDRTSRPSWWKYAILAGIFLAWVGFLIACKIIGSL
ncbi:MAG: hypothetical protein J7L99_01650 [Planctomycetes bacterium]|nr:hypothetical protein [Planctomycetota bacterium]